MAHVWVHAALVDAPGLPLSPRNATSTASDPTHAGSAALEALQTPSAAAGPSTRVPLAAAAIQPIPQQQHDAAVGDAPVPAHDAPSTLHREQTLMLGVGHRLTQHARQSKFYIEACNCLGFHLYTTSALNPDGDWPRKDVMCTSPILRGSGTSLHGKHSPMSSLK